MLIITIIMFLSGCKEPIRTYQLPKQTIYIAGLQQDQVLGWHAPSYWQVQTPDNMVKERYQLASDSGKDVGITLNISVFPGNVGSQLANINRWRAQLQLNALSIEESHNLVTTSTTKSGIEYTRVKLSNTKGDAIDVITMPFNGKTYFFKFTGKHQTLNTHEEDYMTFITDIHVENHD